MSGATEAGAIPDKWGGPAMTTTVETYHSAIRKLVAERFAASGKSWEEAVTDPALELTREDFEKVEAELLATGYRFQMSAVVSLQEEPEKYQAGAGVQNSGTSPPTSRAGWSWARARTSSRPRPTSPARRASSATWRP